ncbi:MAG: DUF3052 family protein [Calditrichales bacterium]|nr:MAG: DUF3052 family protein [Calditrichales bacterium]
MAQKSLAEKLYIRPNYRVILLNENKGYRSLLGDLPENVIIDSQLSGVADLIQVFLTSRQDLETHLPALKQHLVKNGLIWITYPKGTSKIKADINRDSIARFSQSCGLKPVALIAIDADWSALRVKVI